MSGQPLCKREVDEFWRSRFGVSGNQLIEERRGSGGYVLPLRGFRIGRKRRRTMAECWAIVEELERLCS